MPCKEMCVYYCTVQSFEITEQQMQIYISSDAHCFLKAVKGERETDRIFAALLAVCRAFLWLQENRIIVPS